MRIRTQLHLLVGVSATAVLLTTLLVVAAGQRESVAAQAQAQAETIAHEVTGLLTLTQEYTRYGEPRAAEQWHRRQQTIAAALKTQVSPAADAVALAELRSAAAALPALFERLPRSGQVLDAFAERRQAALLDQLLTTTQAMSDFAYQWSQDAAAARAAVERQFRLIAVIAPLLMLLVLAAVALIVQRRVLKPLAGLEHAAVAVARGDLGFRVASTASNEFGALARQFDAMTQALADGRERLSQSERQLRAITDNLPALVGYVDQNEIYRFANASYKTMFGEEPSSFIGASMADKLGPARYESVRAEIRAALGGERRSFERQRRSRGAASYLQIDYIPDRDSDGRVAGVYMMVADITARKLGELRLASSERRLLDLMNNIPAMVGYFDMDERCQFANDTGLRSLGLDRADVQGVTLRAALGEANYAQHEPYVREALEGRRARLNGKSAFQDRAAHFQAHLIPDRIDGGAQRGFYLMTFDITALQEAQQRQAEVEGRLLAITDNLPVVIAYVDADERYAFVNRTFLEWFGLSAASVIGAKVADVVGPTLYAQRSPALQRALAGERVAFEIESEALGVRRCLHNLYMPDIRPDGTVAGLYALSTDVSALKAVERELAQLARSDTLTGLPNRMQFNESLPVALARSRRSGLAAALLFLDVDHFKSINDTLGHAAGDVVLREFAARLRRGVRSTDAVARLAGDEFVVTLEGLHNDGEAQSVAANIVAEVRRPFIVSGREVKVTTSIGIAYHEPGSTDSAAALLARSDEALYAAKIAGRDGFSVAAPLAQPDGVSA